ncbi:MULTISPECIES: 2-hydroxyacid dehydrogenase [Acinetobacter]|uniref:Glyoxylate/hydroxypyruvate reductase A n=1 Tax=Acinetobacter pseudolwoffii TaxID=2053287 RepID=A0A2H9YSB9_9GAMM|nr:MULTISPECIES: glyoxylate/hydroxypyruvate reductase A [Acinetobacter]MCP0910471.1 glyoxylate/hydroxypyruvate reductase A [Acinetobacter pseudolwoffii]PJI30864.1 glyoxylate/hydroxypyruvate reductase A [Acinetobacter pseudolwoffii]PJI36094.1 glyoxylate/hydroxypyruvate reductase A [Acinetobacter pseudolwoffii]PJO75547.1 glyoxylate/hydroxypyruvate reductase A [Acinetobacter pseudolwoffii]UBX51162.1 glyoxylate/hydroxypyruvate reductase A [Acinetobacter pseudolwoffii]
MIVISSTVPNIEAILVKSFQKYAPEDSFCTVDSPEAEQATTAACWFPDLEKLQQLPKLGLIHSIAAGVEHLNLNEIRPDQAVCRVLDPHHQKGMFDYLLWGVLYFQRYFDRMIQQQKQQLWKQYRQSYSQHIQIGIMGLGHMGAYVAERFADMGYQVSGWANSPKEIKQVKSYVGSEQLSDFLAQSQILINLLPLTEENTGILSTELFQQLPEQAALIQVGRGQHLIEQDLLKVLDSGHLRGAIVDVFEQEPLPAEHPFWQHEKIIVTPHVASHAPMSVVVEQILENDRRFKQGLELCHQVDVNKGY